MILHTLACSWSFKLTQRAQLLRFIGLCSLLWSVSLATLAQVIISAEHDSLAVREFARELIHSLPSYNISYMPRVQLEQQQHFADDVQLILLGPQLLDWRLQLTHSQPPTIIMQVSRVQAQQRFAAKIPQHLTLMWSDPPPARQIALLKTMQPDVRHVGVLLSESSAFLLPEIIRALNAQGLLMHTYNWSGDYVARGFHRLLNDTDALLGLDDVQVYNNSTIKHILLSSYARKKALIGPTAAYIKAGSLASTYSSKENWLTTLGAILQTPAQQWPRSLYPDTFEVLVNQQVARSLGVQSKPALELGQSLQRPR